MLFLAITISIVFGLTKAQNQSPCPDIFVYETKKTEENVWYGKVQLTSSTTLNGIWLKIELDRPADLLGNSFGEAITDNNQAYLIKNGNYRLEANRDPLVVRFFVKYSTSTPPSVTIIRLNGRELCAAPVKSSTTTERWFISHTNAPRTTSERSVTQPGPTTTEDSGNGDDDFYPGDLSPSRHNIFAILSPVDVQGQSCGTIKITARPLITYGQSTTEGEWPWHAALYRSKGLSLQYICGGSLISPNHILTAAHCVTKPKTAVTVNPELLTVYLGKYNLVKPSSNVQDKTIAKITVHPEYNATYFHNDIAILELDSSVRITDYVRTVCLWEEDINLSNIVDKLGTIVGWGFDEAGNITENLMLAHMPIVSTDTCIFSNRDFFSRFTSSKTFCAGYRNGTSACTGDSGGGLVLPKSTTSGQNTVWQLRGIISLSAALQNADIVCDTRNYIIFTDVAKHLDWIRQAVTKT